MNKNKDSTNRGKYKLSRKFLKWLVIGMQTNVRFELNDFQQTYIKDIFLSRIGLPTEPSDTYDYYFNLEEDLKYITKVKLKPKHQTKMYF